MTRTYLVEAWNRQIDCIAFRRVARAATAARTAEHYIVDLDADRVYIRAEGEVTGLMADWAATGGWKRCDDPALAAALDMDGGTE